MRGRRRSRAAATIYLRPEGAYVTADDRTTVGLWIGSGNVEVVRERDPASLGRSVLGRLAMSRDGVPHPRHHEWGEQRQRSLGPLVDAAGLRSWRAFIRDASVVEVTRGPTGLTVTPCARDDRRTDVFYPIANKAVELTDPSEIALGEAILSLAGSPGG